MSAAISPSSGRAYGVQRVCRVWDLPRSTVYARRERATRPPRAVRRRGPVPRVSDADLLALIRRDLETSPFTGEGHRKVWARLRRRDGVPVSRKRVLRVMRENHLLSPHRVRRGAGALHEGRITTTGPNQMWGTDGAMVQTVKQGTVWVFVAVEHWNAECVGWHVAKHGDRYAALAPVAMGLKAIYGTLEAEAARGLSLRRDNGPQYISEHFNNQVRFWGMQSSPAFVEEPQTNGVAERFIRTLKEQVVHGRVFQDVEDLREAVAAFVERYNAEWLVEKVGFVSPRRARELHGLRQVA
jgi:transposase InsO family protein